MLFFRAEDMARKWCESKEGTVGPLVTMDQLWSLSTTWYSTRLSVDSRRPKPDEMVEIFAGLGLVGSFWDPRADDFGSD